MERIVGIDLGTTNSVVAYFEQGQVHVIQNSEGAKTTPSVVLLKSPEEVIVGELAKRQLITNPTQTIRSIKRFMGARFSEISEERRCGISYRLVPGPNDSVLVDVGWGTFSPEQISACILRKMRSTAEDYFGETVTKAVITVPAYFNDSQRAATKRAGELAGLEVLRIINEPTAAALGYGVDRKISQKIAVFDFGGGTFDVSILDVEHDVFEVRSTNGNTFLGGDNIDDALVQQFVTRFERDTGAKILADAQASQRLREAVEKVKCELSGAAETVLSLPFIAGTAAGPVHLNYPVRRADLEELIQPILPGLTHSCESALSDAALSYKDIASVLLVGGSTRIPAVQDTVRKFFGKEPNRTLNPDEAVAVGAAVQAGILGGSLREVLLLDVTPLSLGIEASGGQFSVLIPRNSSIPTAVHKKFTTVRDNQPTVRIHVLQGERKIASENYSLGVFQLSGISPAPKEIPEISVSFQIDANGILEVAATDVTSGKSSSITIESVGHLTQELIESTVVAAEEKASEDRAFVRKRQLKTRVEDHEAKFQLLFADKARPLEPDVEMAIKEALFRFDVAYSGADLNEIELAFERVEALADEFAAQLIMKQYETTGLDD